jgi:hypothetical protein
MITCRSSRALSVLVVGIYAQATTPYCLSADIRVRLVNTEDGKPMKGQPIILYLGRDHSAHLEQRTDGDGVAAFHLTDPATDWLTPGDASYGIHYNCSPYQKCTFPTAEVLQRGVVALNVCSPRDKLKGKVAAKPGEIVIFARPLHWWEKAQW